MHPVEGPVERHEKKKAQSIFDVAATIGSLGCLVEDCQVSKSAKDSRYKAKVQALSTGRKDPEVDSQQSGSGSDLRSAGDPGKAHAT